MKTSLTMCPESVGHYNWLGYRTRLLEFLCEEFGSDIWSRHQSAYEVGFVEYINEQLVDPHVEASWAAAKVRQGANDEK
jgi:hypothetical protein